VQISRRSSKLLLKVLNSPEAEDFPRANVKIAPARLIAAVSKSD